MFERLGVHFSHLVASGSFDESLPRLARRANLRRRPAVLPSGARRTRRSFIPRSLSIKMFPRRAVSAAPGTQPAKLSRAAPDAFLGAVSAVRAARAVGAAAGVVPITDFTCEAGNARAAREGFMRSGAAVKPNRLYR